tara:strand:- start:1608 stop:1721 length:114 start_codon:yes stop_codon:yes gene_type:complete
MNEEETILVNQETLMVGSTMELNISGVTYFIQVVGIS